RREPCFGASNSSGLRPCLGCGRDHLLWATREPVRRAGALHVYPAKREWVRNGRTGAWLIGFRAPSQIGSLRPEHATLHAEIAAPQHVITLLRAQCQDGKAVENPAGQRLVEWKRPVSEYTLQFDCRENDFDANGCVWLLLKVDSSSDAGAAAWHIAKLEVGIRG